MYSINNKKTKARQEPKWFDEKCGREEKKKKGETPALRLENEQNAGKNQGPEFLFQNKNCLFSAENIKVRFLQREIKNIQVPVSTHKEYLKAPTQCSYNFAPFSLNNGTIKMLKVVKGDSNALPLSTVWEQKLDEGP